MSHLRTANFAVVKSLKRSDVTFGSGCKMGGDSHYFYAKGLETAGLPNIEVCSSGWSELSLNEAMVILVAIVEALEQGRAFSAEPTIFQSCTGRRFWSRIEMAPEFFDAPGPILSLTEIAE